MPQCVSCGNSTSSRSPTTNYQQTNYQQTSKPNNKQERIKMKLHEAIKGMEVKSWERRENSNGKCTVYVRFVPKSSAPTVNVKEVAG